MTASQTGGDFVGNNILKKYISMNIKCAGWLLHGAVACGLAAVVFDPRFSVVGAVMLAGVMKRLYIDTFYKRSAYFYQSVPVSLNMSLAVKTAICSYAGFFVILGMRAQSFRLMDCVAAAVLSTLLLAVMTASVSFAVISMDCVNRREGKGKAMISGCAVMCVLIFAVKFIENGMTGAFGNSAASQAAVIIFALIISLIAVITDIRTINKNYIV